MDDNNTSAWEDYLAHLSENNLSILEDVDLDIDLDLDLDLDIDLNIDLEYEKLEEQRLRNIRFLQRIALQEAKATGNAYAYKDEIPF